MLLNDHNNISVNKASLIWFNGKASAQYELRHGIESQEWLTIKHLKHFLSSQQYQITCQYEYPTATPWASRRANHQTP